MAVALMRSVLLTESVEVLPHYHPPGSTQNTGSGDSREVMQLSQPQESTWKAQRTRCSPRTSSERWAGVTPKWQQAFIAQRWPTVSAFRRRELPECSDLCPSQRCCSEVFFLLLLFVEESWQRKQRAPSPLLLAADTSVKS